MLHMKFNMERKQEKIFIRVGPHDKPTVDTFCAKYKEYLQDAKKTGQKVRVLFDLRLATLPGYNNASDRLKVFFGQEIHNLSESVIKDVTVVCPNTLIKQGIQIIFKLFPGTVETKFLDDMPKKE